MNDALLGAQKLQELFALDKRKLANAYPGVLKDVLDDYDKLCKEAGASTSSFIRLGSVFKRFVWGGSISKAVTGLFQTYKSQQPPGHLAAMKETIDYALLNSLYKKNKIFLENSLRQNMLHQAKPEVFVWLLEKDPKAFFYLCAQQDQSGQTPISLLIFRVNYKDLYKMLPSSFISEYKDTAGNNCAHQIAMFITDQKKLLNLVQWLQIKDPELFIMKNNLGENAIDTFCRIYKSISAFNPDFKNEYAEVLAFLRKIVSSSPAETATIDQALSQGKSSLLNSKPF